MKVEAKIRSCLKPMPKIIVTVRDKKGRDNALVVGYACNCSYDPPMIMVGIVPSRFSYHMIKENGSFVVNVAADYNKEMYDYLGSVSGSDENKMKKFNTKDADVVNATILTDCPINIECKVVDSIMTGSHEMFVGKIEKLHVDENLVDEDKNILYNKFNMV